MDWYTPKRKPMSEINVVPYIDVMLVLLVIFMVTAPLLMQGVDVDLPQVDSQPLQVDEQNPPLIVAVSALGGYYTELGDDQSRPMELAQVREQVKKITTQKPGVKVLIRGDENVTYGKVVQLLAVLQDAGIANVGLITEKPR
ncbi:protein TolR [Hahella sp. SMD15-11]|uniref:Tol-Pal system protein TolR n=1 Tax=Thermohahella caldifontis TaxID=3142973 RepID=A0AB39UXF2_9GAMM